MKGKEEASDKGMPLSECVKGRREKGEREERGGEKKSQTKLESQQAGRNPGSFG